MKVYILNGPNLNLLGKREPEIYGNETWEDILLFLRNTFPEYELLDFQSNVEGELVTYLQGLLHSDAAAVLINAGAYSHYSYALHDALKLLSIPKIEVHLSNIFQREAFRHHSVLSAVCEGVVSGFGKYSYAMALFGLPAFVKKG
ncbi:MAG: type II 3-dehydroquinate dehydratase [Bacteroidia bacterium]